MSMNLFEARTNKAPSRIARLDAFLEQHTDTYNPMNVTESFLRDMRKYSRKAAAKAMFEYLTEGKLPFDGIYEAATLARYALFANDPDIMFDQRKLNDEPNSTEFDVFWANKLAAQLVEIEIDYNV
eukprot:jgi/Tetstr1/440935/TSEL_029204.t1